MRIDPACVCSSIASEVFRVLGKTPSAISCRRCATRWLALICRNATVALPVEESSCFACRGTPREDRSLPLKMIVPCVETRIEKIGFLTAARIDSGDARPFMVFAFKACQRQIVELGASVYLSRDHVIHFKASWVKNNP